MDDCIDLFYILLPRILFAIPEKNFSAHISCGRHERFAAARLQSIFPYCNQPIFNQQLTLTEDRNYILLRCFCRARLLRLQPYFFFLALCFLSLPTTLAVNHMLLRICSASFCNGPSFRRLPLFLLVQRFFVCYIPKTTAMRCAVLFCQRLTCRRPPLLLGNLALATPPPRELLPRNRPGKALLGGCRSI